MVLWINKVPRAPVYALVESLHLAKGGVSISLRYRKRTFWPKVTAIPLVPTGSAVFDIFLWHIWGVYNTTVVFTKNTLSAAASGGMILTQHFIPSCHGDLFIHQEHPICVRRASQICRVEPSFPTCLPTQSVLMEVLLVTWA